MYFISRAINFVFQTRWKFPWYLKKVLKPIVIAEIILQFMYQIPYDQLHAGEENPKGWQRIIGFISVWQLDKDTNLPVIVNVSNLILKCIMYSFILIQQYIFVSREYMTFINVTLSQIRNLSERKAEAMAFLYNNMKIKITIQNQFEKDKMMKKLARVNKQLKKWNQTVFTRTKGVAEESLKPIKKAMEPKEPKKITEVDEHLEEDKDHNVFNANPKLIIRDDPKMKVVHTILTDSEADAAAEAAQLKEENREKEKEYETLTQADLVKRLTDDKLSLPWKLFILGKRHLTNQILLVFNIIKLDGILDSVRNGETKIYTTIEKKLVQDFNTNKYIRDEEKYDTIDDIPEDKRSNLAGKATKAYKLLAAYSHLVAHIILSNSAFVCYLLMIVAMIMNGCIISLVYPVSVFIYALLEEKRPNKKYWQFIVMYTSTVLVIKFVLQTYPLSDWLTRDVDESGREQEHNSVNDYLRTIRLGLEVVVDGRNFVSFFLFEALILLTVTLHIFIQVFGGVWDDREIEKETIHQAAARIANVQKQRRLEKSGKIKNREEEESLDDLLAQKYDAGVRPPDYHRLIRRRAYSVNDCLRMTEV